MYEGVPPERRDPFRLIPLHAALRDWPASEKLCWAALQRDPDDRRAWRWLADVLSWKGDYPRSLEWFEKLAKANPDDADVRFRIGEVRLWSGDAASALIAFHALLERSFELPQVWNGFLSAAGRVSSLTPSHMKMVARIRERATANDPAGDKLRANPVFLANLGRAVAKTGDEAEGGQFLSQAFALDPREPAIRRELAGVLAGAGHYSEARKLYASLTLDIEDRFGLIAICAAGMDFDEAKRECLEILKLEPANRRAKHLLADVTSWKGEHAEALVLFRNLIKEDPDDLDARIRLAEVTLWSKNPAEALKLFQSLPVKALERAQVRRGLVDAAAALDEKSRLQIDTRVLAAAANRALGESDALGSDVVHLARLGIVLVRIGEKGQAMRVLDRAVMLNAMDPATRIELGGAMQVAERFDDAIRQYEGLTLSTDSRFRRLEALSALKRFDLALAEAENLVRSRSDDLEAKRWLADIRSWKGDYAEAIRQFRELAKLLPADRDLPLRLAEVTLWSGDAASAVDLFQTLPDSALDDPKTRRAYIDAVAGLAPDAPTKPQAAKTLRSAELSLKAGDVLANEPTTLSRLAIGLVHSGEVDTAGRVLDRALALPAATPAIRLELGGALVAAGRFADALRMYDGLRFDKDNRFRKVELFAAQKQWSEALVECRAVLARDPEDLDAQRRLADLLSWKGDFAESIQLFAKLVQMRPADLGILVRLAEVTLWAKQPAKAFVLFDQLPEAAFERPEVRRGYIDAAAALAPDAGAKANHDRLLAVAKKSQNAGDKLGTDVVFLARLGLALHRVGEKEQAAKVLKRAADLPSTDPAVRLELGGILVTAGLHARALRVYKGLDLTGESRFRRLELLAAQKDWPASVLEAKRLLVRDAADKAAKRWLADVLLARSAMWLAIRCRVPLVPSNW
jgi:tetratricopeptide (TPR) repeat protein